MDLINGCAMSEQPGGSWCERGSSPSASFANAALTFGVMTGVHSNAQLAGSSNVQGHHESMLSHQRQVQPIGQSQPGIAELDAAIASTAAEFACMELQKEQGSRRQTRDGQAGLDNISQQHANYPSFQRGVAGPNEEGVMQRTSEAGRHLDATPELWQNDTYRLGQGDAALHSNAQLADVDAELLFNKG